ncbi:MAG: isoleucine--tRNA ligase [Nitrososphaerota archaeon]|nr:isoleucine--tRNA ligase [Candidatus Calditenuaceae archaeon]MDW8073697.1 isoleucine--tRNA ligase [Nitrososphaerota archaeon]
MYALPPHYDFRRVEDEVSKLWSENEIPRRLAEANRGAPIFSFLEGPPTVNSYMHIGHARGRVYKDIVLRFQVMKGLDVWRRAGWDCQGLPVELEVEKRLGVTSKKDIESIGMERFVEEAHSLVDYYISQWRKDSERLGLWLDYDTAYQTRDEKYMEHVWALLEKCFESGDLVVSLKVVPFCPRCETPLSSHEVAQGYEEVEDYSIYVKFPVEGDSKRYLLIWTTTPWTLPANEAVAVNPEEDYVEFEADGEKMIVAQKLLERVMKDAGVLSFRVLRRFTGGSLVGLKYRHALAEEVPVHIRHEPPAHTVLPAEFVSMEEGTGLVHIAPGHGPEDFELGKREGLPVFCPIATNGVFTGEGGRFAGMGHREAAELVLKVLGEKGLLLKEGRVVHTYPHCWRCNTPLIFLTSRQWFLKVDRIKRLMIEENAKVRWYPSWAGQNRFGEWLENAEDWCISRTRVWGTPLNIWTCSKCGAMRAVGSKAELEKAERKPTPLKMHRPWVDRVVFRCDKCGGEMFREPFVLDTWLDSGVAHFASVDWLRDKSLFEKLFPYDFITEAIDQTRGWFYTLLFTSALMFGRAPYKAVLSQNFVLDKFGKKMSKSKGNVLWAADAMDKWGVDNVRMYLVSKAQSWETINFDPDEVKQIHMALNILWNVVSFAKTYFDLDRYDPDKESVWAMLAYAEPEDRWILSRINTLIKYVHSAIERFDIHEAARGLLNFIVEDLSRTYVRAVRRRFWIEERTQKKIAAYASLHYVLLKLLPVLSIFTPYIAEYLYQRLRGENDPISVCLNKWPRVDDSLVNPEIEDQMQVAEDAIAATLNARNRARRKLRWPLRRIILSPNSPRARDALKSLKSYVERMTNSFSVEVLEVGERPSEIVKRLVPVQSRLGPRAGRRYQLVSEALASARAAEVLDNVSRSGRHTLILRDGSVFDIVEGDFRVEEETPSHIFEGEGRFVRAYIDVSEDERLKSISLANEVIRRIQVMRKELNLEIVKEVPCMVSIEPQSIQETLKPLIEYIEEETRTRIGLGTGLVSAEGVYKREWELEHGRLFITIQLEEEGEDAGSG